MGRMYPQSTLMKLRRPTASWPPDWFCQFIENWEGERSTYDIGLDHGRRYKHVAVFSPYHACGEDLCEFLLECQRQGFEVLLVGKTSYYPSCSFTMCVYRKQDEEEVWEFVEGIETNIPVPTEHTPVVSR